MIGSDVATEVREIFGDKAAVVFDDAAVLRWINRGQRHLVKNNEGLLEIVAQQNTVASQQEYTVPADMMTLRSIRHKDIHLKGLHLKEFDEYIDGWSDPALTGGTGVPQAYTVWAGKIILYPIPATSDTNALKIYYTRNPAALATITGTVDLPESYHNALINYVLQRAYEKDEDAQGQQTKAVEVADDLATLKNREKWTNQEQYPRITTLPEDW